MKYNIALITGGYSGEAVVSYKSTNNVFNNIDKEKYNCYIIDIRKDGWLYMNEDNKEVEVNKNDFSIEINGDKIKFDLSFICLHGTPGEDGKIQGYLDCLKIPYTSSSAINSAIMCNKYYTTIVASRNGINVSKSLKLYKHSNLVECTYKIVNELKLPVFVKPNNGGSSIGSSKVTSLYEVNNALESAFKEDDEVLVEEFIHGREFTVGVIRIKGEIVVLPITEIISENTFFDFEAKYNGKCQEVTPAVINEEMSEQLINNSKKIYEIFDCKGVIRIDYIYNNNDNKPYLLEINSIPGQSEHSIIPKQVIAMGWSLTKFYSTIINNSLEHLSQPETSASLPL